MRIRFENACAYGTFSKTTSSPSSRPRVTIPRRLSPSSSMRRESRPMIVTWCPRSSSRCAKW